MPELPSGASVVSTGLAQYPQIYYDQGSKHPKHPKHPRGKAGGKGK